MRANLVHSSRGKLWIKMGSGCSPNDLRLRKMRAFLTPSKYVYMPWRVPIGIKRKSWCYTDANAAYKIATPINRMRESFSAMFAEMVPRISSHITSMQKEDSSKRRLLSIKRGMKTTTFGYGG